MIDWAEKLARTRARGLPGVDPEAAANAGRLALVETAQKFPGVPPARFQALARYVIMRAVESLPRRPRPRAPAQAEEPGPAADDQIPDVPTLSIVRRKMAASRLPQDGRVRAKTIAGRLRREERLAGLDLQAPKDVLRPLTRGDCDEDPGRPCPWVGCSHHLYLDVNPETGAITFNFPHLEVWEMAETCSLDVADRGGITLEEVGKFTNRTRERVRQIQERALAQGKAAGLEIAPDRHHSPLGAVIAA